MHDRDDGSASLRDNLLAAAAGDREAQAAAFAEIRRIHVEPPRHRTTLGEACQAQQLRDLAARTRGERAR